MKKIIKPSRTVLAILFSVFILFLSFIIFRTNLFVTAPNQSFLLEPISAIILPHHDLADNYRLDLLSQVSQKVNPKTIIVISTNHFEVGSYNILTTVKEWKLKNALFDPDSAKISSLNIKTDHLAFDREHGIYNLLEPLKNNFADAKIVPIILKQNTTASQLDELVVNLNRVCRADCLLVGSVDFSHYQPASVASIHDLLSIKALNNLDKSLIWQTEVDSNPTLYLAIEFAKLKKSNSFHLVTNTNSGLMEHTPDAESTSYILGWFEYAKMTKQQTETFTAGYDISKQKDSRLIKGTDQIIDLLSSHDMAINCLDRPEFCSLNRILWSPNFYRDILNGLVIVGEITSTGYKLVLVPTQNGLALRDQEKLAVINRIRMKLGLDATQITDGYDIIEITK